MPAGSCVCGAVAFELRPPYRFFQSCHCSRCRKRSGSIHAANIAVPKDQFTWLRGEAHVQKFELSTAKAWGNAFCTTCGSTMPWLNRTGLAYVVAAGALDDDPIERPLRNIHVGSRAGWAIAATALPEVDDPMKG